MPRKSPYKHNVKRHTRAGVNVKSYERGKRKPPKVKLKDVIHSRRTSFYSNLGKRKMSQEDRIRKQWERGHSGDTDMSFVNMSQEEYYEFRHLYAPFNSIKDIKSYDIPRSDLLFFYGPTDRKIYIAKGNKDTRKILKTEARTQVFNNFTIKEVMEMGPLYLQVGGESRGSAGSCRHVRSIPHKTHITGQIRTPHMIYIKGKYIQDPSVLTHELIHAKRFGMKDYVRDQDREETETELETMCRLSPTEFKKRGLAGYYYRIPEIKKLIRENYSVAIRRMKEMQKKDRKLIIGGNYRLKGKLLTERINRLFPKSHISKAKFSLGEKLDRYFLIKKGTLKEYLHIGYIKPVDDRTVYADLRKQYPSAQIYEIKDGKEVRI